MNEGRIDLSILVSILCMTYNHELYIEDAIEGFLQQKTNYDVEIIIGEDCSTDNTRKIVKKYMNEYPGKIKMITSDHNVGMNKNAQRLIESSRGKYIAICEGDDYWTDPFKLQKQIDYMEEHPECSLCFHAAEIVINKEKQTGNLVRPYNNNKICPTEDIILGGGGFCPTASLLFPRRIIEHLPAFFQKAHVGDYPLQMWTACQGYAYYMDEIMAAYRIGNQSSWTNQLIREGDLKEKLIKVKMGDIQLLKEFNRTTDNKYNPVIEETILKREFEILLLQHNLRKLKTTKYKILYTQLTTIEKLKLLTKFYFPRAYRAMVGMKKIMYRNN
ncbi:glycosyltransferase [Heyndrickxia oleronia]